MEFGTNLAFEAKQEKKSSAEGIQELLSGTGAILSVAALQTYYPG